jgi:hypothetical protein
MAFTDPTVTATLPATVVAEIVAEVPDEKFLSGAQTVTYKVPCEKADLRGNRSYDVKQAAVAALEAKGIPTVQPESGFVIRSKSKLTGKTLTVTLYWGKKVSKAEDAS